MSAYSVRQVICYYFGPVFADTFPERLVERVVSGTQERIDVSTTLGLQLCRFWFQRARCMFPEKSIQFLMNLIPKL